MILKNVKLLIVLLVKAQPIKHVKDVNMDILYQTMVKNAKNVIQTVSLVINIKTVNTVNLDSLLMDLNAYNVLMVVHSVKKKRKLKN